MIPPVFFPGQGSHLRPVTSLQHLLGSDRLLSGDCASVLHASPQARLQGPRHQEEQKGVIQPGTTRDGGSPVAAG